jgi:phage replication-related protein YjqB (UPF0714/DUF867 family)
VDYTIRTTEGSSNALILAPHGGGIEPGTTEIGCAVAATEHSLYLFEGLKHSYNRTLHITSTNFDEPTALAMLSRSTRTVVIHGFSSRRKVAYIGGRDTLLATALINALNRSNIPALRSPTTFFQGEHPRNLCNCNGRSMGVQIEISTGLRQTMFKNLSRSGRRTPTRAFHNLVDTVRSCLVEEGTPKS